ncbi:VacJ family lipoprotein [Idiomarina seosinensis]|uniref:ABC transporter n=1 Tax=Idiomarina seosinensis TaxID=281739 RepID=A0A432ZGI5_9GAMM|nr:VacJ family lipoprotein [Idiomarina seosinensis]RUO77078.1 hypothetical protein CWI81_00810 [Idiomarina seosinensis]
MSKPYLIKVLTGLSAVFMLSACSSTPEDPYADERDPLEDMNRVVWDFNQELDEAVIKPTAEAYENIPEPIRRSLYRAFENLQEPWSAVNNVLQAKPSGAGYSVGRFAVNSTIGILGLFDPASSIGLEKSEESLGETLALWGVPNGPYIMLPVIGPTVLIDRGTDWVDGQFFPYTEIDSDWDIPRYVVKGLEMRLRLRDQEQVLENALDPYTFVKEAYYQNWLYKVYDGNPPEQPDEFEDDYSEQYSEDAFDENLENAF